VLPEAARCVAFSNDPDGKQHVAVGMKKGRFAVFSLDSLVKGFKLRSDKPATPQSKQPESVDHVPYGFTPKIGNLHYYCLEGPTWVALGDYWGACMGGMLLSPL